MYTHARQFPHLQGMSDDTIRTLVRDGMAKRPTLISILRIRNVAVAAAMALAVLGLKNVAGWSAGAAMTVAGLVATLFLLAWNYVWINYVVFKLTQEEVSGR